MGSEHKSCSRHAAGGGGGGGMQIITLFYKDIDLFRCKDINPFQLGLQRTKDRMLLDFFLFK